MSEVFVDSGDYPDIHGNWLVGAHRKECLSLKGLKKLGLDIERQVSNFVQENGTFVGGGQRSCLGSIRTGKSSALMAEYRISASPSRYYELTSKFAKSWIRLHTGKITFSGRLPSYKLEVA